MGKELKKLLYVEDDEDIQEIARLALEEVGGFTIKICSTGKQALVAGPLFIPDLILLDVMMPEMDGVTTFLEMKKIPALKDVPVIFLTAKVQADEVTGYKKLGAADVIYKPFNPMAISDQIKKIWQEQIHNSRV